MEKPLLIGISGKSGSGKTTISQKIAKLCDDNVIIIKLDDYYHSQDHLPLKKRKLVNYDHPNAFDWKLLINNLKQLQIGCILKKPLYDFINHTRHQDLESIKIDKVVILEGIYTLYNSHVRDMLDIKIYIDADDDECLIRRIKRDTKTRGRKLNDIFTQYQNFVKPMASAYLKPTKQYADFIIPNNKDVHVAINSIAQLINFHTSKEYDEK